MSLGLLSTELINKVPVAITCPRAVFCDGSRTSKFTFD
jgi:hypothetical protein